MPDKITSTIHLFADGTKICFQLTNQNQTNALQNNIDRLDEWSDRWKLIFNVATCKTMQIGYHTTTHTFTRWDQGEPDGPQPSYLRKRYVYYFPGRPPVYLQLIMTRL